MANKNMTYAEALHAMQTAVAYEMTLRGRQSATDPKHLRVGINSAMSDQGALATLLIRKGIISSEEYIEEIRQAMIREVERYEATHPGITFA